MGDNSECEGPPNKYGVVYSRKVENSKRIVFYFSRRSLRIQVMRISGARPGWGTEDGLVSWKETEEEEEEYS